MLFSVYNNNAKDNEWLPDNKVHKASIKLIPRTNITRETFGLNPYVSGVNINNNSFTGPNSDLLKKETDKQLYEFSALFMMKIKEFKKRFNYFFEIKSRPLYVLDERTNKKVYLENNVYICVRDHKNYQTSDSECNKNESCKKIQNMLQDKINIYNSYYYYDKDKMNDDVESIEDCYKNSECQTKLPLIQKHLTFFNQLQDNNFYNIEIKVGTESFFIYNVNDKIFKNESTLMGLIYKDKSITFYINDTTYNFDLAKSTEIVLENNIPISINDQGNTDAVLYSFAYYDKAICEKDVHIFKMFNYFYMFGANKIYEEKQQFINENKELKKRIEDTKQSATSTSS